ncbi:MAG: ParB/RepB/Spo0J family partition protein [Clostridiales bacterium]|nr:ParB/RepB/Spo0J family partition protein [Clostridiales bacterium]
MTKKRLGKGLDALFQSYEPLEDEISENEGVIEVKINEIDPNIQQPRRNFDDESIMELSRSIMEHGVVQPIIVKPAKDRYTIVAGERRWRAARLAGLDKIPIIVRDMDEKEMLEIALIENLQREDLNPMEESEGINSLIESYGLTQEQVGKRLGKSRSAIANALRLNNLPTGIKDLLIKKAITAGHARALLGLNDDELMLKTAETIITRELSVREAETLVNKLKEGKNKKQKRPPKSKPSYIISLEEKMEETLGTKVTIMQGAKKGTIEIEYYGHEDLERLIEIISIP